MKMKRIKPISDKQAVLNAELKIVSGTYRRDRSTPKTTLARLERMPTAPKHLSDETRKQWRRLAPAAKEAGTMTASDVIAFELLCRTLATAIEAEQIIADEGATIAAGSGGRKAHPALAMMATARAQATALLAQFGLTPRGRATVAPAPARTGNRFTGLRS